MTILQNDWDTILKSEFEEAYYKNLMKELQKEYNRGTIYPDIHDIFNAIFYTSYHDTKVVILGQDPYHGPGQAHGLSFSVKAGTKIPPSLQNIYKELRSDLGYEIPNHGYLESWTREGVLLLNTVLTVAKGEPNSHKGLGWETFTDKIVSVLNQREKPVVFILWGKHAQNKGALITEKHHYIIEAPHPSPFSAHKGFFGSKPFSKANELLETAGLGLINWRIKNI